MKVSDYRAQLAGLEQKVTELTSVHDQYAFGYAKIVLAEARSKVQTDLDILLNLELKPVAYIINILSSVLTISKAVGDVEQLDVTARFSDSTTKNVTKSKKMYTSYRDTDITYNNLGMIIAIDGSSYTGAVSEGYLVVKTFNGWVVYGDAGTNGLEVTAVKDSGGAVIPNSFELVNMAGLTEGLKFTTDGNEATGDSWRIEVSVELAGTVYTSSNNLVAKVSSDGLVTATGVGSANITVQNNGSFITIPVTVA